MKGMIKNYRCYFKFLLIILLFTVLSGCCGVTPTSYTVTATAGAGGSINLSGAIVVSEGENQTFTITPEEGYEISDVLVDSVSVGAVSTYTFNNIQQDHTIAASFAQTGTPSAPAIIKYTITATAGTGGSIAPEGSVKVTKGNDQTFTITPDAGYEIDNVLVDGSSQGPIDTYTFQNVQENHTIQANFSANKYTVSLSVNPTGTYSVVAYGGGTYNVGDAVQISAVSQPGVIYYFDHWYDNDNNQIVSSDATYNFIMPAADVNYTAYFGPF